MTYPDLFERDRKLETAFRRGFVQGVAVIAGLRHKLSDAERHEIDHWFNDELTPWSNFMGLEDKMPAPDLPSLRGASQLLDVDYWPYSMQV